MNESMANYVTDTPSEVAELIELNKQLEQENNALKKTILKIGDEYKALKMQNESLETWSDHYKNGLTSGEKKLVEENAMMRDALEFYADIKTYIWDEFAFEILPSSDIEEIKTGHYVDMYGGKRAREVLAKLTKGEVSEG